MKLIFKQGDPKLVEEFTKFQGYTKFRKSNKIYYLYASLALNISLIALIIILRLYGKA